MKRILVILLVIIITGIAISSWIFLGSATSFEGTKEVLYISTGAASKQAVMDSLIKNRIIKNQFAFEWLATRMNYWNSIRPGKYEIKRGTNLLSITRMLRNGQQTPVNLVITKLRTKEDFSKLTGNKFEFDSLSMISFLNNKDSLEAYSVNPDEAMSLVLPDTYTYLWNTTPAKVYSRLAAEAKKFWTKDRKIKAGALGLTQAAVSTLASIVDEETNAASEKGLIASVYLNRIKKGMPLQADPTVKFALKNFSLKRIYEKHLFITSPYNTYRNRGLPPGPICTPSKKTIDAVLNAPKTNYLYFVASPKFNGSHEFSATYEEHLAKAKLYQQALNRQDSLRNHR